MGIKLMTGNHQSDRGRPRRAPPQTFAALSGRTRSYGLLLICLFALRTSPGAATAEQPTPVGRFDYYLLALTWSPQYCAEHRTEATAATQCGKRRGFVVHGLWPQNQSGPSPGFCYASEPVPAPLVETMLPIMPSDRLVQHQWSKHGTCSGASMQTYFGDLGRAFGNLRTPKILQQPKTTVTVRLDRLKEMFAEANPGLTTRMLTISCAGADGMAEEVRVCLDKSLNFRACPADRTDRCREGSVRFRASE